jgi:hypothetical protein
MQALCFFKRCKQGHRGSGVMSVTFKLSDNLTLPVKMLQSTRDVMLDLSEMRFNPSPIHLGFPPWIFLPTAMQLPDPMFGGWLYSDPRSSNPASIRYSRRGQFPDPGHV